MTQQESVSLGDNATLQVPLRTRSGKVFVPGDNYSLIFTAKLDPSDADEDAVIQKMSGGFGVTTRGRHAFVALLPDDTDSLASGITLYCDIQAQRISDNSVQTVAYLEILTVRDITRELTTSIEVYVASPGLTYDTQLITYS